MKEPVTYWHKGRRVTVPRGPRRSPKGTVARSSRPEKSREVKLPDLYVKLAGRSFYGERYAKARVRFRRGVYAYLVWRDGQATREFYLGKRENHAPQDPAGGLASSHQVARDRAPRGTK